MSIQSRGQSVIEVCQTEQVAVPGSYLDRLLKTSQSITYDFLNLSQIVARLWAVIEI
ncbi:MAG: hypothetical protein JO061_02750 [Acidobacteriaceae bacterium]|nr:hypothetical protein [Acidobacteriaceae bacterium]